MKVANSLLVGKVIRIEVRENGEVTKESEGVESRGGTSGKGSGVKKISGVKVHELKTVDEGMNHGACLALCREKKESASVVEGKKSNLVDFSFRGEGITKPDKAIGNSKEALSSAK
jgi:hypothetical protein